MRSLRCGSLEAKKEFEPEPKFSLNGLWSFKSGESGEGEGRSKVAVSSCGRDRDEFWSFAVRTLSGRICVDSNSVRTYVELTKCSESLGGVSKGATQDVLSFLRLWKRAF
jgi:hypothetical protein